MNPLKNGAVRILRLTFEFVYSVLPDNSNQCKSVLTPSNVTTTVLSTSPQEIK